MERGTDTGSPTLIDATVAMAASSRLAYLVSYFANPGGDWQGALIKYTASQPPGPGSDTDQDMVFHSLVGPALVGNRIPNPIATDLSGRVEWYFDHQQSGLGITTMSSGTLLPGGTVIGMGSDRDSGRNNLDVLREIDLAGNPVRETNLAAVNAQLTVLGHEISYGFHHEVQRLPNGDTVVLALTERKIDINGTPTNYIGDMVVVLDEDLQVAW